MFTAPDGTGMITAGLDGWFDHYEHDTLEREEFRLSEWRLEEYLHVAELRRPPDNRQRRHGVPATNTNLTVPALLFPLYHFCPSCRALTARAAHEASRGRCPRCEANSGGKTSGGKKRFAPFLAQVPFVALCADGHLQDFPWREWVHRSANPTCQAQMYLRSTGGATLASQMVSCDCGVDPRSLSGITNASDDVSVLSNNLDESGQDYTCQGRRAWVDDRVGQGCGLHLRGSLRASTAAYFAHVESAIYLPGGATGVADGLREAFDRAFSASTVDMLLSIGKLDVETVKKGDKGGELDEFNDGEIAKLLDELSSSKEAAAQTPSTSLDPNSLRRSEFGILREEKDSDDLVVSVQNIPDYSDDVSSRFTRVNLIEKLRETRALYGFSRIQPNSGTPLTDLKARLWQDEPNFEQSWLPAYEVKGEGIYLELDESALQVWEASSNVLGRAQLLMGHHYRERVIGASGDPAMIPRYILLHTLSHLLINQLVFECGYSSASLRERLFCSLGPNPMSGILIYTAAGDSEGTMGGLVRMGRPGVLEPAVISALERARWCSSDPVCMELGEKGQGPNSMNLAACHSCGLLPETACEAFNVFLDRALVIGTSEDPSVGFFAQH